MVETARLRGRSRGEASSRATGARCSLTPTEWQIVEMLVRHPGKLVSQRQLLQEVWGPQYERETNYLRVYMAQIRRKLEPDPPRPRYFITEPRHGLPIPAGRTADGCSSAKIRDARARHRDSPGARS